MITQNLLKELQNKIFPAINFKELNHLNRVSLSPEILNSMRITIQMFSMQIGYFILIHSNENDNRLKYGFASRFEEVFQKLTYGGDSNDQMVQYLEKSVLPNIKGWQIEPLKYLINHCSQPSKSDSELVLKFLLKYQLLTEDEKYINTKSSEQNKLFKAQKEPEQKQKNQQLERIKKIDRTLESLKYCKINEFSENLPNEIKNSFSRFFMVENLDKSIGHSIIVPKDSGIALIDSNIKPIMEEETKQNLLISDFLGKFKQKYTKKYRQQIIYKDQITLKDQMTLNSLISVCSIDEIRSTLQLLSQNISKNVGKYPHFEAHPIIYVNLCRQSKLNDFQNVFQKLNLFCKMTINIIQDIKQKKNQIQHFRFFIASQAQQLRNKLQSMHQQVEGETICQAQNWFETTFMIDLVAFFQKNLISQSQRKFHELKALKVLQMVDGIQLQQFYVKLNQNNLQFKTRVLYILQLVAQIFNSQSNQEVGKYFKEIQYYQASSQIIFSLVKIEDYGLNDMIIFQLFENQKYLQAIMKLFKLSLEAQQLEVKYILNSMNNSQISEILRKIYCHFVHNKQLIVSNIKPLPLGIKQNNQYARNSSPLALTFGRISLTIFYKDEIDFSKDRKQKMIGLLLHELTHKFIDILSKLKCGEESMGIDQNLPQIGPQIIESGLKFQQFFFGGSLNLQKNKPISNEHREKFKILLKEQEKKQSKIKKPAVKKRSKYSKKKGPDGRFSDSSESESECFGFKSNKRIMKKLAKTFLNLCVAEQTDEGEDEDEEEQPYNPRDQIPIFTPIVKESRVERARRLGIIGQGKIKWELQQEKLKKKKYN